ncbi:MAG: 3-deoxy-manno-octulosonate cytidylyltransferase [Gammaproteobacteria bacterium]
MTISNDLVFHVVIPARYASTRLPAKMLADIAAKPMIQHVYERACQSGAASVVIATDDERILSEVDKFTAQVCMTSPNHQTGTDRIAEVLTQHSYGEQDIIVNVQGDEPLISAKDILQVASDLAATSDIVMASLCERITDESVIANPNVVKVVRDQQNRALYFSRAPLPWDQKHFPRRYPSNLHFRHMGLYAARAGFIKDFVTWERSPLEEIESLEQLRVQWYGHKILVNEAKVGGCISVDTPADLERVRDKLQAK